VNSEALLKIAARVSPDSFVLNGLSIDGAIAPAELHRLLGSPSRIEAAKTPVPYGHRSNQWHIYDSLGIYFYEHHYTRMLSGMSFHFRQNTETTFYAPERDFSGDLRLGSYEIPLTVSEKVLIAECGLPFVEDLGGYWHLKRKVSLLLITRGDKLKSGRQSAVRRLLSVEIGWPHDPWAEPRLDG
jgi:hypothetical protein